MIWLRSYSSVAALPRAAQLIGTLLLYFSLYFLSGFRMSIASSRVRKGRQPDSKTSTRPRTGRPTLEEAKRLHEKLLEVALDMFLERGFDGTTVEDIATTARMSKRTVYARYATKDELFVAAVNRARERYTISLEELEAQDTDNLESTLKAVARRRFENIAGPVGRKLFRVVTTQAYRFPDLALSTFNQGATPAFEHLVKVFARYEAKGEIQIEDHRKAAAAFLSMALGPAYRIITTGNQLSKTEFEESIDFSTRLFLNGILRRRVSDGVAS